MDDKLSTRKPFYISYPSTISYSKPCRINHFFLDISLCPLSLLIETLMSTWLILFFGVYIIAEAQKTPTSQHVKTNEHIFCRNCVYIEVDRKNYVFKYSIGDYVVKYSRHSQILKLKVINLRCSHCVSETSQLM